VIPSMSIRRPLTSGSGACSELSTQRPRDRGCRGRRLSSVRNASARKPR
jgi:hypothetical protein